MTALEIILLFAGFACIVVSFVMPAKSEIKQNTSIEPELSEFQLEAIRDKVETAVEQEIENVVEKTEISLDKISNTKILEMQEYANTIFNEMNRNHNETMFLYDMLNEKAKDIKNIVRDLNLIRQKTAGTAEENGGEISDQDAKANELIEHLFLQAAEEEAMAVQGEQAVQALKETAATKSSTASKSTKRPAAKKTTTKTTAKTTTRTKSTKNTDAGEEAPKEEKTKNPEKTEKKTTRTRTKKPAIVDTKAQIISMHESGKSVLEIAKALDVGVGQTRLVIDLYEGQK